MSAVGSPDPAAPVPAGPDRPRATAAASAPPGPAALSLQETLARSRDAPVGGQAVIEGVMMRGVRHWAVASRLPDGGVAVTTVQREGPARRRLFRLPLIRGIVGMVDSMAIGLRALGIATDAQLAHDPDGAGAGAGEAGAATGLSGGVWAGTIVVAVLFAVGLFFVVPVTLTSLIKDQLGSSWLFWLVEGLVRTVIFLLYLLALTRMADMRRVLEYHGAEHKTISCYEAGDELTPARAARYSRLHPRCGTSFLLIVMIISIFIFAPIGLPAWWILVLTRIAGVPVIVGLSFEVIKWAGAHRARRWVQWVMAPGLALQRLTTAEPSLDQLAVAIAALEAVLARETPGSLRAEDLIGVEVSA
ncbi:DUF1385 domain-containing protein [Conexibacter sp. DBS9H8]|uniref:DUF1385 domain-containing protein n=1 Tax=Conexibacter sp. DBS9H8 TaxID=2937801 RepID=UPI00200FE70A|nr:DUF1385 domain-containing protein [Conexibacter sp. DBS9H8]